MWRSIGAKATGSAHIQANTPCQDSFEYALLPSGVLAIAVADGAGSASSSLLGAEASVQAAIAGLREFPELESGDESQWTRAMDSAFETARRHVLELAEARNALPRDFATTLQVLLVGPASYCYGRIGDGGTVGVIDDQLIALGPAPANTYVNETSFLTSDGALPEIVCRNGMMSGCAVFTDGLQHLAMKLATWEPHSPFFRPLFEFARGSTDTDEASRKLDGYLQGERIDQRSDDDRTLVIAIRK